MSGISNGARIVSWNVNGLRSLANNDYWESFLAGVKPDIFCLQETKASPEQLTEQFLSPAGYSAFFSSCEVRKGYSGVAIYSKIEPLKVIYGMGTKEFDQEGRIIAAEYDAFWLINAYFPNGGQGPERLEQSSDPFPPCKLPLKASLGYPEVLHLCLELAPLHQEAIPLSLHHGDHDPEDRYLLSQGLHQGMVFDGYLLSNHGWPGLGSLALSWWSLSLLGRWLTLATLGLAFLRGSGEGGEVSSQLLKADNNGRGGIPWGSHVLEGAFLHPSPDRPLCLA